jgi:L-lysine exporter family protein LysE/ArgO
MPLLSASLQGFALSLGLIVALGPQNAFVIRQGLMRAHVFLVCLVCTLADIALIALGTLGVGAALDAHEQAYLPMTLGAASFLVAYGALRLRSSMQAEGMDLGTMHTASRGRTVFAALAFTFLNPLVYLDTLVLIGGYALRFDVTERLAFTVGASMASMLFFFSLGYGSSRVASQLSSARAWMWIDRSIAALMFLFAANLLLPLL